MTVAAFLLVAGAAVLHAGTVILHALYFFSLGHAYAAGDLACVALAR